MITPQPALYTDSGARGTDGARTGGNRSVLRASGAVLVLGTGLIGVAFWTPLGAGLALAAVFGLVVWALLAIERRRWGLIGLGSPLSLTAAFWFIYFALLALGAYGPASRDRLLGSNAWLIAGATLVVLLSLLLVAATYLPLTRLHASGTQRPTATAVVFGALVAVFVIGWTARIALLEIGAFGYLSGGAIATGVGNRLVQTAASLVPFGMVVLTLAAWSPNRLTGLPPRRAKVLFLVNLLPLLITALGSGVKGQLVSDLVPAGVAYLMMRGRIPWLGVAATIVYLVAILPGIEQYREDLNSGVISSEQRRGTINAAINSSSRVVTGWASASPGDHSLRLWDHFTDEYATMSRNLAVILNRTPRDIPHLGNQRLVAELFFFLPGSLLGRGDFNVYVHVNAVYLEGPTTSASPPTQPGDFYMSGGWLTVVVGQLVVGGFLAVVWRTLVARRRSVAAIAVYATLAGVFVSAGVEWGVLVRGMLQAALVLLPLARLVLPSRESALGSPANGRMTSS